MKIEISAGELRERQIFVGTPMYAGQCSGNYTKSCVDLAKVATMYGMNVAFHYLFNESLITRGRNYIADEFLRHTDYTHLMFIDSDVGFNANDVLSLAALASDDSEYDIICGPYPKKVIAWEKIRAAVNQGVADENATRLEEYVGDYVFNVPPGTEQMRLDEPVEVLEGGTGFMLIRRKTFERWNEAHPELLYTPDHSRSTDFDGSRQIMCYFNAEIDKESQRYLSEDYLFCQQSRKLGLKVWMCPWMRLTHVGSYVFGGSLQALASIGAAPTSDMNEIGKGETKEEKPDKKRVWKK